MNRDMLNKNELKKGSLHAHLIDLAEMCLVRVASKILSASHHQHLLPDLLIQLPNHFPLGEDLTQNEREMTLV